MSVRDLHEEVTTDLAAAQACLGHDEAQSLWVARAQVHATLLVAEEIALLRTALGAPRFQ